MSDTKKEFKGVLAEPISPRRFPLLATEAENEEAAALFAQEDSDKLLALMEHYGITYGPSGFYLLALALARQFVPGFQEKKKVGRKTKWDDHVRATLVVEIERVLEKKSAGSIDWASTTLCKRDPWRSFVGSKDGTNRLDPAEVLRTQYFLGRDSQWAKIARHAYKYHCEVGTLAEWDTEVFNLVRKHESN